MANAKDAGTEIPQFKLLIVGDRHVGKSTFVKRHLSGNYEKKYIATLSVEIHPMVFSTNKCNIKFNVWDPLFFAKLGERKDTYYASAKCAIILFDVTEEDSYENVTTWYDKLISTCGNIPIVLCGNKVDLNDRKVEPKSITFHRKHRKCQYFDVSAKTNYNWEKPFLWLARKIVGDPSLNLLTQPALAPPDVQLDHALMQKYEQLLEEALQQPLDEEENAAKS